MPQPKKGPRLGSNPSHQRLMLSNLALSLFEHERIKTTEAKAKLLRPFAERLITKARKGTVHHRRQVLSVIENREVVHKLFADIGPRFADRNGGYTRILKLGPRNGDGAPMAVIELVEEGRAARPGEQPEEGEGRRRFRRAGRRRAGAPEQDKPARPKAAEAAAAGRAAAGATEPEAAPEGDAAAVPSDEPEQATEAGGGAPERRETRSDQESKQD